MTMGNLAGTGQALDSSLNTIYSAFLLLRDATGVFRSCATKLTLKPHEGRSKNVNNYNRVVAYDIGDGVDIQQAQQLADTTTSYTPGEVAVQVLLPGSTMRRVADPDLLKRTGRMLSAAYDLKEDQDGGLQMVNWTPTMGATSRSLGAGEFLGAVQRISVGNSVTNPEPAPEPYYIVAHPTHLTALHAQLAPLTDVPTGTSVYVAASAASGGTAGPGSRAGMTDEIIKRGIGAVGSFWGATVKKSAKPTDPPPPTGGGG